jgi:DDE family transposase
VVSSLSIKELAARELYEQLYCAGGEMENRIKEAQLDLFADRLSTATFRANQLRLWFASAAYVRMHALRRLALADTALSRAVRIRSG